MLIAMIPVLVMVLGLLVWALATNPIAQAAGERMFTCGLLVTLLVLARWTVRIP